MKLKFSLSKDQKLRATIRVPFRIGREELIAVVAHRVTRDSYDINDGELILNDESPFRSRTSVAQAALYAYKTYGEMKISYWGDDLTVEESNVIRAFATVVVDKLFPELKPA